MQCRKKLKRGHNDVIFACDDLGSIACYNIISFNIILIIYADLFFHICLYVCAIFHMRMELLAHHENFTF